MCAQASIPRTRRIRTMCTPHTRQLDYSKNIATEETLALLEKLCEAAKIDEEAAKMFSGVKINNTEKRAVLHVALRKIANERATHAAAHAAAPLLLCAEHIPSDRAQRAGITIAATHAAVAAAVVAAHANTKAE